MGLAEKRAIAAFQETNFPQFQQKIESAAGFAVPLEVKWEKLGSDGYAEKYNEFFSRVYFEPLISALSTIGADKMGKDALKSGLKKIVITNDNGYYSPGKAISFANGVLTIDHEPHSNVDNVGERTSAIQAAIEKAL